jgi:hypothetical protein
MAVAFAVEGVIARAMNYSCTAMFFFLCKGIKYTPKTGAFLSILFHRVYVGALRQNLLYYGL